MPTFTYKARNNKGELKESSLLANNASDAKAALKQEGLWIIDIKQLDKEEIKEIETPFAQGSTLSDALEAHPKIFDRLYISMVKAGEAGGVLEQVLNRLAIFMEERSRLTQQVKAAMTYPVVVMFIAVGVFYAMLTLVLPTFSGLFNSLGSELPAYTQLLIKTSDFLRSW